MALFMTKPQMIKQFRKEFIKPQFKTGEGIEIKDLEQFISQVWDEGEKAGKSTMLDLLIDRKELAPFHIEQLQGLKELLRLSEED